ncbi:hypothetical protein [Nocardia sp. X0981]
MAGSAGTLSGQAESAGGGEPGQADAGGAEYFGGGDGFGAVVTTKSARADETVAVYGDPRVL